MEQRLLRTSLHDGTQVAFARSGGGPPLVHAAGWLSHLELGWALPPERGFYEQLGRGRTLLRYDRPGCGLSGPADALPSLHLELDTLGAVVDAAGSRRVDLFGSSLGAPVAAAWAAAHPDRVSRLVLYGGWARGRELADPDLREHLVEVVRTHWGLGSEVLADIFAPDAPAGLRAAFVRYQREASSAGLAAALLALAYDVDVSAVLGQVRSPTLVVHREADRAAPVSQARALAQGIRDARLVVLPGRSHLPYVGDVDALGAAIRAFLGLAALPPTPPPALTPRQREVAALVADGLPDREIAARLGIAVRSAEGHVERIRDRLGFRSRAQVAAWFVATHDAD